MHKATVRVMIRKAVSFNINTFVKLNPVLVSLLLQFFSLILGHKFKAVSNENDYVEDCQKGDSDGG